MTDHSMFELTQPGTFAIRLTEVLRTSARVLLAQAVEAEGDAWMATISCRK